MKNWPQFVNFRVFEHSDSLFRLLLAPCIEKRRRGGLVIRAMNVRSSGPNLTGIIILYSLARHVTFTVPLSFQVDNGGSLTECHGIASHPGWSSNTPVTLHTAGAPEIWIDKSGFSWRENCILSWRQMHLDLGLFIHINVLPVQSFSFFEKKNGDTDAVACAHAPVLFTGSELDPGWLSPLYCGLVG